MKRCPQCGRTYADANLAFCLADGKPLELVGAAPVPPAAFVPPAASQPNPTAPAYVPPPPMQPGTSPAANPYANIPPHQMPASAVVPPLGGSAPKKGNRIPVAVTVVVVLVVGYGMLQNRQPTQVHRQPNPGGIRQTNPGTGTDAPNEQPTATPTNEPPANTPPPGNGTANGTETAIRNAVIYSDAAEVVAEKTLNTLPLYKYFDGAALSAELTKINDLKRQGIYAVNRLEKQQFGDIQINSDNTQATIQVTETWSSAYYSTTTKQQTGGKPSSTEPQMMTLVLKNGDWVVVEDKAQSQ